MSTESAHSSDDLNPAEGLNKSSSRVPLRLIVTLPFFLQVVLTVGGLGYCFWRAQDDAMRDRATSLSQQSLALTQQQIERQTQGVAQVTEVVAEDLTTGTMRLQNFDLDQWGPYLQRRTAAFAPDSPLEIVTPRHQFLGIAAATDPADNAWPYHLSLVHDRTKGGLMVYGATAQGKPGRLLNRLSKPENLPDWYSSAIADSKLTWQRRAAPGSLLAVRPFGQPGQPLGVVAAGLAYDQIDRGLESLEIPGEVLLLDGDGKLLASSRPKIAQAWAEALGRQGGTSTKSVTITLEGQQHWMRVTPWRDGRGLDWRIVTLLPRSALAAQMNMYYRHTLLFGGGTVLGSLLIWALTFHGLLKPMRRLNQAAKDLAQGGDLGPLRSLSQNRIGELGEMAQSLSQVALRLRASSQNVVQLNQALFNSKQHLTTLFEALPVGVMVYDRAGQCLYLNRTGQLLLGVQNLTQVPLDRMASAYRIYRTNGETLYPQAELPIVQALQGKAVYVDDMEIRRREMTMPLEVRATPVTDGSGQVVYAVQTFQNVITRKQAENALRQSESRMRRLAENVPGMVFRYVRRKDGSDAFTYVSPHCRELYEIEPEQLISNTGIVWSMMVPEDAAAMQASAQGAIDAMQPWNMTYRIYTSSGKFKWITSYASPDLAEDGEVYWDGVAFDDTERKQAEEVLLDYRQTLERQVQERTMALQQAMWELDRLATLDGLTQVANRRRFDSYLSQEWQRLSRSLQPLSLILCDVDYFKRYNDHYGHQAGDLCLQMIAQAMDGMVRRPADLVARYGGEEFAILLPQTDRAGAEQVAEALHRAVRLLEIPHDTSQVNQHITMSIGVATMLPLQHQLPDELIRRADQALYLAKEEGRDRICYMRGGPMVVISA
jgi:diguanylate cyclase (GGDEF)-like protein/PAS domain S-box-containing protein